MAQRGAACVPVAEEGTAMIAAATTPPAEPGSCRGPRSTQLAQPRQGRAPRQDR